MHVVLQHNAVINANRVNMLHDKISEKGTAKGCQKVLKTTRKASRELNIFLEPIIAWTLQRGSNKSSGASLASHPFECFPLGFMND